MKKKSKYYYAIKRGRKMGIVSTWSACSKLVQGYPNSKYKCFNTKEAACIYLGISIDSVDKYVIEKPLKYCPLCQAPHRLKHQLCGKCHRRAKQFKQEKGVGLSIGMLCHLRDKYNPENFWDWCFDNPTLINLEYRMTTSKYRSHKRHESKDLIANIEGYYDKTIPMFVINLLSQYPQYKCLKVHGEKNAPKIYCQCLKCNQRFVSDYQTFRHTNPHHCPCNISSGESIIIEFLKDNGIQYRTQKKTLRCVNPTTGFVLPYDIEIVGRKIIIEVQGEQHYKYIPYFHRDFQAFEKQQERDKIKKEYALKRGYYFLEIGYDEIHSGKYRSKIMQALSASSDKDTTNNLLVDTKQNLC